MCTAVLLSRTLPVSLPLVVYSAPIAVISEVFWAFLTAKNTTCIFASGKEEKMGKPEFCQQCVTS